MVGLPCIKCVEFDELLDSQGTLLHVVCFFLLLLVSCICHLRCIFILLWSSFNGTEHHLWCKLRLIVSIIL